MTKEKLVVGQDEKVALVIDMRDNVAVALTDLKHGEMCTLLMEKAVEKLRVKEAIRFGHKIALQNFDKNESVYKYGEEIGKSKERIEKGSWIHSHNMYCERGMK